MTVVNVDGEFQMPPFFSANVFHFDTNGIPYVNGFHTAVHTGGGEGGGGGGGVKAPYLSYISHCTKMHILRP